MIIMIAAVIDSIWPLPEGFTLIAAGLIAAVAAFALGIAFTTWDRDWIDRLLGGVGLGTAIFFVNCAVAFPGCVAVGFSR